MNTMCLLSLLLSLLIYLSKYYINYLQNKKKQYSQDIIFLIRLSLQNSTFSRKKCGIKYIGYIKKYFPYNYSVRNQAFKERDGICQAPRRQRKQPRTLWDFPSDSIVFVMHDRSLRQQQMGYAKERTSEWVLVTPERPTYVSD